LGQHDVRDNDEHGDEGAEQQLVRVVALAGRNMLMHGGDEDIGVDHGPQAPRCRGSTRFF
jgi:hypothetical protein